VSHAVAIVTVIMSMITLTARRIPFAAPAFFLTYDALTSSDHKASTSRFDPLKMCTYLAEAACVGPPFSHLGHLLTRP
jgi:hypothetical protein